MSSLNVEIILTAKHFKMLPAKQSYIRKKLSKLDKHYGKITNVEAILKKEGYRYIMELSLQAPGVTFNAMEMAGDICSAVDNGVKKIQQQIKKYKDRLTKEHHRGKLSAEVHLIPKEGAFDESEELRIVQTKKYDIKPMSVKEAIIQMDALNRYFLPFVNSLTGKVNVIYARNDGSYVLIEPKF